MQRAVAPRQALPAGRQPGNVLRSNGPETGEPGDGAIVQYVPALRYPMCLYPGDATNKDEEADHLLSTAFQCVFAATWIVCVAGHLPTRAHLAILEAANRQH